GTLTGRSLSGFTANTAAGHADVVLSGAGNISLVNSGNITLDNLTAANGSIVVEAYGNVTAATVRTNGTSDANDITVITHAVGTNLGTLTFTTLQAGGSGDITLL